MSLKNKTLLFLFLFLLTTSILKGQIKDTCWHQAYSIKEALGMQDSCNLFLSVDEYVKDINSTWLISDSLSRCRNVVILGFGTTRYLKIDADFSKLSRLEEFGINGRIKKNSVSTSIAQCKNLQRVAIGFTDSSKYVFPIFLNRLGDNIRLIITYDFYSINKRKAFKCIANFLKRTTIKTIGISSTGDLDLNLEKKELYKDYHFKKIIKSAQKKHIDLSLFGIRIN